MRKHDIARLAPAAEREVRGRYTGGRSGPPTGSPTGARGPRGVLRRRDHLEDPRRRTHKLEPSGRALYGWTAAEADRSARLLPRPARQGRRVGRDDARPCAGERVDYFQTVRLHRDGWRIDLALTLSPIRDHDGQLVGVLKTARDITEQKRGEQNLRTSESRLHQQTGILRSILDHIERRGRRSRRTWQIRAVQSGGRADSPDWESRINARPEEWSERYSLYRPDGTTLYPTADIPLVKALRGENMDDAEMVVNYHGVPEPRWVSMNARPMRDEAGVIRGGIAVMRDVTDKKRAEDVLRLRDRAIQAVTQGILITDPSQPDNPIIYASPGFERLTGYAAGRSASAATAGSSRARTPTRTRSRGSGRRSGPGEPCTVELLNYRKDGTPFWNELSISPGPGRGRAG